MEASRIDFLFFDSGTGGLPYMLRLKELEPSARCVYVGDTQNFPYGEKPLDEIVRLAEQAVARAVERFRPAVVVIACNTISVAALQALRRRFSVPFVGTVPAIKLAAEKSKNRRIGLLATRHTIEDSYTEKLVADFAGDCAVFRRGDAELVSFIEHNLFTASRAEKCRACLPAVEFFRQNGVDTVALGCTHFLHIINEFEATAGNGISVVDSRDGVARQALRLRSSLLKSAAGSACAGETGAGSAGMAARRAGETQAGAAGGNDAGAGETVRGANEANASVANANPVGSVGDLARGVDKARAGAAGENNAGAGELASGACKTRTNAANANPVGSADELRAGAADANAARADEVRFAPSLDAALVPDMGVYVTSLRTPRDQAEYRSWCESAHVPFMGLLGN